MVIGDKVKLINHALYNDMYGKILDINYDSESCKVLMDSDNKWVWVPMDKVTIILEETTSGHYNKHYQNMPVQPIELAQDILTPEELMGAMKFSIIKYELRAGYKDGEPKEKDKAKSKHYKEWLEILRKGERITV